MFSITEWYTTITTSSYREAAESFKGIRRKVLGVEVHPIHIQPTQICHSSKVVFGHGKHAGHLWILADAQQLKRLRKSVGCHLRQLILAHEEIGQLGHSLESRFVDDRDAARFENERCQVVKINGRPNIVRQEEV